MSAIASLPDLSLGTVFLFYTGLVAVLVGAVLWRYLPPGRARIGIGVVAVWLCYAGAMGYAGIVGDPTRRPPGIVVLLTPIIAFVAIVIGRSPVGRKLAAVIPLSTIVALQSFRVGVELTLSSLHEAGLTPRLLTLGGGNVEILVGLSAPLMAFVATRGAGGRRMALAWNLIGLVSLLNVAARAVLTAPGPLNLIHAELPNVAMGMFPFSFIPGFMAPLAMMLHVLAFRALRAAKVAPVRDIGFAFQANCIARPSDGRGSQASDGRKVCFLKKEPKNFCLFGAAPGGAEEDQDGAGAKVFWFFFSKKNTARVLPTLSEPAARGQRLAGLSSFRRSRCGWPLR